MSIVLHDSNWLELVCDSQISSSAEIWIISPFLSRKAVSHLLRVVRSAKINVLTRFNLNEFHEGVSDIEGLELFLERGATVKGIRNLHAKVYVYGHNKAFVTSANLTWAALTRNSEYGVELNDKYSIDECLKYCNSLWRNASKKLTLDQLKKWKQTLREHEENQKESNRPVAFPDFGADVGIAPPISDSEFSFQTAPSSFVKFFGTSKGREPYSRTILECIHRSGCHWACTYPRKKKP